MKVVLGDPGTELTWGLLKRWAEASNVSDDMSVVACVPVIVATQVGSRLIQRRIRLNDLNLGEASYENPGELALIFEGKMTLCHGGAG